MGLLTPLGGITLAAFTHVNAVEFVSMPGWFAAAENGLTCLTHKKRHVY